MQRSSSLKKVSWLIQMDGSRNSQRRGYTMATEIVIVRGKYTPRFQITRAWLSAASAIISINPTRALNFIDEARSELAQLEKDLTMQIKSMR
jgi:hypothetical protein